jgi:hypothetical protein
VRTKFGAFPEINTHTPSAFFVHAIELASELFTSTCGARRLAGLHLPEAVRESCRGNISPCSLVLALLYLERLKTADDLQAREYLAEVTPSELFIVSMVHFFLFASLKYISVCRHAYFLCCVLLCLRNNSSIHG